MTPADIAKALTPAQVRALRDPNGCTADEFDALFDMMRWGPLLYFNREYTQSDLGRAVLDQLAGTDAT